MRGEDFTAILEYLELNDEPAALAFGVTPAAISAMRSGEEPIPFLVSAMTVLMVESDKATRLALEHGRAWRDQELSLADLMREATGVGVFIPARKTHLQLVENGAPGSDV